jgi:glucose/arabinose dehydrogenase
VKPALRLSAFLAVALSALALAGPATAAPELPSGFQDSIVLSESPEPTTMRFAPGGEVFVATKSGQILVYEGIEDKTPAVFADLRTEVYDNGDRGLLGLALDPDFVSNHYVYALYTYDHILGGQGEEGKVPRWGTPSTSGDPCPKPGDADVDACPVSGRLVRLTAEGDHAAPSAAAPAEKILLEDWCQQFSSHSIGDLQFGPEGALYASGGDGASFNNADYGQFGWPQKNICGDPPGAIGQALSPPEAEGGALRSQDLRTPADPTTLDGSVVRIDPQTGGAWHENPLVGDGDPNAERIVAYGFRNPFRFTIDPASGEIYVGNVGWDTYEEIDRVPAVGALPLFNSGWPCYEGPGENPIYAGLELNLCKSLYAEPGATTLPLFYYKHYENVVPEEACNSGTGSALAGLAFYPGGPYPDSYDGALFFADPVRGCIWVMHPGDDGRPDPLDTTTFMSNGGLYPGVDIEVGPEGDLYYVKLFGDTEEGTIHRISYDADAPVARLTADTRSGPAPLEAHLDASGSSDPHGKPLSFEWDLDGNGSFETDGGEKRTTDLNVSHNVDVAVRVGNGEKSSVAELTLYPDDEPPQPTIVAPAETMTWGVGQKIDFSGSASDIDEGGELPASDLYWKTRLYHCPSACHAHPLQVFPAVKEGSLLAPDHDYPSHIEISLTATDARGLTATKAISIYPRTVDLKIDSDPGGIGLTAGQLGGSVPIEFRAIEGAHVGLSAPLTADVGGREYRWQSWSDGGARAHTIVAGASATYTANYALPGGPPPPPPSSPPRLPRPRPGIHAHLPRFTPRRGAVFSLISSQPGVGFRCRLDAKPFLPCGATRAYRHLALGWHTFRAIAVGGEDWTDSPAAVFRWKVVCAAGERVIRQQRACARPAGSAGRRGR